MGLINRGVKTSAGGGTAFKDNTDALASEVNTDLDTVYSEVNGNLDENNVPALPWSVISTAPDPEDIDDTSGTGAEQDVSQSPGDHSSRTLATNVEDELQQLRYGVERLGIGTNTVRQDTASEEDVSWIEDVPGGPNLVINGGFGLYSGDTATPDVADGWAFVGTPTTSEIEQDSQAEGTTVSYHVVAGIGEGVQQTVTDLKGDTRYLIVVDAKVASGDTWNLITTGADTNEWDDVSDTLTATSFTKKGYVVETDSTPTDIVIRFTGTAAADDINIREVSMRELGTMPRTERTGWTYPAVKISTSTALSASLADISGLAQDVVVPGPGYEVEVTYGMNFTAGGSNAAVWFDVTEDTVQVLEAGTVFSMQASQGGFLQKTITRIGLAAGTYTYQVRGRRDNAVSISANDAVIGQLDSTLVCKVRKRGA